ncbi:MAG: hypothetical protein N2444_11140, partial [Methylocystis sp.]|nr:hypothetical protein [Methylocystis sp.]
MILFKRRERWTLTWRGWLLAAGISFASLATLAAQLNDFLSTNAPVGGEYLVVEGWMPAFAYREAAQRFRSGAYKKIIAAAVLDED